MEKRLIYALKCPFTNDVHYIGKSTQGMLHPLQHLSESHSEKVKEWVHNLKELNHAPVIEILESVSMVENLDMKERFWIAKFLDKGALLLNSQLITSTLVNTKLDELLGDRRINPTEKIAAFVKAKRKRHDLTQEQLSDKSGVGLRFIRELEQGNKTSLQIGKIQEVLNLFDSTLEVVKQKRN